MSRSTLSLRSVVPLLVLACSVGFTTVNAQLDPAVTQPLADKRFTYPDQIVRYFSYCILEERSATNYCDVTAVHGRH